MELEDEQGASHRIARTLFSAAVMNDNAVYRLAPGDDVEEIRVIVRRLARERGERIRTRARDGVVVAQIPVVSSTASRQLRVESLSLEGNAFH